ncbi:FAD-dependent oxidoreductase [Streptomyces sp. 3MP-14]|uniref:FAD-dependent oxidoreductase n=1 Tax=Streptomyces mimosae TaxID=2586635 RepID=A0A5N6A228_9ACTN|nr:MULTISPECIES: FAD-dependent oxidoreductase [Streptomyces]KAB8161720.1 FAD-dependent oxidoreductase [Streptomyces mimosae]KAB8175012.1 FAD-dependent oxidoreductase [Streptomyces sp. 3MP-14]
MRRADVVVVGLGVHGSAVSAELAARGRRVVGVERSGADQVWGASQGPVRMVRENDAQRPWLAPLARESVERWRRLSGPDGRAVLRRVPAVLRGPADAAGPAAGSDPDAGLLDARASVLALRESAVERGAELLFGRHAGLAARRPVGPGPARLRVGGEDVAADLVLLCAGAWSAHHPGWARLPGLRVEPAPMQLATFEGAGDPSVRDAFHLFAEGDERFCVVPLGAGGRLQFGHFSAPASVAHVGALEIARESRRRDLAALRRHFPALGRIGEHTTVQGRHTLSPDGSFVLRWVAPRVATLVACSGIGFKFAPAIARRVAAAVCGERGPLDGVRVERWD